MVKNKMIMIPGIIALSSMILYHIVLKLTPQDINPLVSLFFAYVVAGIICLGAFFIFSDSNSFASEFKKVNWTSILLGIVLVGIELGLIILYRNGSDISTTSLTLCTMMTVFLLVVGIMFFNESMTFKNILGLVISIVGLWLIQSK